MLESCRWRLADVDLLGVGVGPGSFTGLRIGITTARTLGATLKKPVIGVSSLAALARPVALWLGTRKERTLVVAATDACKGELFALYGAARSVADCAMAADGDRAGLWKRGVEERVLSPEALVQSGEAQADRGGRGIRLDRDRGRASPLRRFLVQPAPRKGARAAGGFRQLDPREIRGPAGLGSLPGRACPRRPGHSSPLSPRFRRRAEIEGRLAREKGWVARAVFVPARPARRFLLIADLGGGFDPVRADRVPSLRLCAQLHAGVGGASPFLGRDRGLHRVCDAP